MQAKRNLAHRMGRWSGTHPKTAIFGWLAFVLIAFFIGNAVGTKTLDPADYLLFCNTVEEESDGTVEVHYAKGMHRAFTVG